MRRSVSVAALVTLQAALCFAPSLALLHAAMQTDGRGIPETHIPLSPDAYPYYAAQFRFFTPNRAILYVRFAHRGTFSKAERNIRPSDFHVEVESLNPEAYNPDGAWSPEYAVIFPNRSVEWNGNGVGPLVGSVLYGGRKYLIGVRTAENASAHDWEKYEMILRVEEPEQPQRMSGFGVFLMFGSVLSAGVGAALFRRNLWRRGIFL